MRGKKLGFFITGTDTGVGKTVLTAGLLATLRRRGIDAVAIKPIQSGGLLQNDKLISEDAHFYCTVSDLPYTEWELNPLCLQAPLAPAVAAQREGVTIDLKIIMEHFQSMSARHQLILVEGAGGLMVPLIGAHVTVADLAVRMGLPLLIVARPSLGTVNHICLTVAYAYSRGLKVAGIILNKCNIKNPDLAEQTNLSLIEAMTGIPVLGQVADLRKATGAEGYPQPDELLVAIERGVNLERLLNKSSN